MEWPKAKVNTQAGELSKIDSVIPSIPIFIPQKTNSMCLIHLITSQFTSISQDEDAQHVLFRENIISC